MCDWCSQLKEHKLFLFAHVICERIFLNSVKERQYAENQITVIYLCVGATVLKMPTQYLYAGLNKTSIP